MIRSAVITFACALPILASLATPCQAQDEVRRETVFIGHTHAYYLVPYSVDKAFCDSADPVENAKCFPATFLQYVSAENVAQLARLVDASHLLDDELKRWIEAVPPGRAISTGENPFLFGSEGQITVSNYQANDDGDVVLDGDMLLGNVKGLQQHSANLLLTVANRLSPERLGNTELALWIATASEITPADKKKAATPFLEKGIPLWRNSCIPVRLEPGLASDRRDKLLKAADIWNGSGAKLEVSLDPDPAIVCPGNPVVTPEWEGKGCGASIGPTAISATADLRYIEWFIPRLVLSDECEAGTIVHEFFHLAGFMHEHQRTGLEKYLRRKPLNNENYSVFLTRKFSDYDPCSITHYREGKGFDVTDTGRKRAEACRGQFNGPVTLPGQRKTLSEMDVKAINDIYLPKPAPQQ